jgi:hypothetical protein
MRRNGSNLILGAGVILLAVLACKFSATTANISSLKLGKDKNVKDETTTFAPDDTIYALANISNASEKLKVKGRLAFEDVEGQKKGPIPGLEDDVELPGSGTATFTFTPPGSGWPKGKYQVQIIMLNEGGEQKDEKSVTFTVS